MAILKIARMGHPVLRRPALPVADPSSPDIARLVADMADTLADSGGVGLAAPQVHVPLRLILFMVPASRTEEGEGAAGVPLTVLMNPEIEVLDETPLHRVEGCLSLPDMAGMVPRPSKIRYRGVGLGGEPVDAQASGFHARVILHEVDHLDGVLYPMRMTDLSSFGFVSELRKGQDDHS